MNDARTASNVTRVGIRNALGDTLSDKGTIVILMVVTIIIIVCVIGYIVWRVTRRSLMSVMLASTPLRIDTLRSPKIYDSAKLPVTSNGQEYAFSFWLYLTKFDTTTAPKLIFYRGPSSSTAVGGSPVVFMDSTTNKMYIAVATNGKEPTSTLSGIQSDNLYLVAQIDYVPLQRWVNVTFTIKDSLLSVFLDGDLYTVESTLSAPPGYGNTATFKGINGPVVLGINDKKSMWSVQGYISRLQFFNYALSVGDVRAIASKGPSSGSMLAKIGLSDYGVRSPVYRITETNSDDRHDD